MGLEEQIENVLKSHPEGLKARIIAKKIGYDKSALNSYLYSNRNHTFCRDDEYKWSINSELIKTKEKKRKTTHRARTTEVTPAIIKPNDDNESIKQLPQYIEDMIDTFSFSNEDEFLKADLTRYIGDEVNPQFSKDLRRKLRFRKLITHGKLQKMLDGVLGKGTKFREGQEEAILALADGKKVLVVQHTGWGKSLVYFITTKLFREQGRGPTVIVSPLLALMHNQIESAKKYGLIVRQITSDTKDEWQDTYRLISQNKVDVIFLSPERLADERFMDEFMGGLVNIALFVVDEAHCISDWGHDFRPDFRRIVQFVNNLPEDTPVLATTATANNRVLRDIKHQLGQKLEIQRGTMDRPSIDVDVLHFDTDSDKDDWLRNNIRSIPGTGIIYCLTRKSCKKVCDLVSKYVPAAMYHAQISNEDKLRIEKEFQENEIKVLVATVAFGMGIDKPDIEFVIHYHQPANAVAYYQQIGRAGRNIPHSYAIAMVGSGDNYINSYFISNAFPTEDQMNLVIEYITDNHGRSKQELVEDLGVTKDWADKVLKYLLVNGDIEKTNNIYIKSSKKWVCDMTRARIVSWYRWKELREFNRFLDTDQCYMQYMRKELDDVEAKPCGHCSNCKGYHFFE